MNLMREDFHEYSVRQRSTYEHGEPDESYRNDAESMVDEKHPP